MGIKISQLPALGTPLPPDAELEISYGANSYKVTGQEIADGSGGGGPAAWATFKGTATVALLGSSNILSLDKVATGHYKLTFATSLATSSYAAVFGTQRADSGSDFIGAAIGQGESPDFDGTTVKIGTENYTAASLLVNLTFDGARGLSGTVAAPSGNGDTTLFGFPLPDTGFTWVSCKVVTFSPNTIGSKAFGVYMTDGTNYISLGMRSTNGGLIVHANGSEIFNGDGSGATPKWVRLIVTTGTTISYEKSLDGSSWTSLGTYDPGVSMTSCGFACLSNGNATGTYTVDLRDFKTDNQPPGIAAKDQDHCYIETYNPKTAARMDAPLVCVSFFE